MSISKIVITGGPCGGKSSVLGRLRSAFEDLGYTVVILEESATELIRSGITPESCGSMYEFERAQIQYQLAREKAICETAGRMNREKVLIICDRGTMDSKAFLTAEEFERALNELGTDEVTLRDDYDAVFHMESTAKGLEEAYTTENNAARRELPEEAAELDSKVMSVWLGHTHLRVIENCGNFEEKVQKLIWDIKDFLGEPEPLEIERKFLIRYPDPDELKDASRYGRVQIEQTYLRDGEGDFRVRRRGLNGSYIYFLTRKKTISAAVRIEIEERINREEYERYLAEAGDISAGISKDRYCFVHEGQYFELDVFPFWKDRALLEIELRCEDEEVHLPPQFEIIREVTEEKEYRNSYLASHKPADA